jgi:hypothetical protein
MFSRAFPVALPLLPHGAVWPRAAFAGPHCFTDEPPAKKFTNLADAIYRYQQVAVSGVRRLECMDSPLMQGVND